MRKSKPSVPTEAEESKTLYQHLEARGILYCHVPNEQRHRRHGVKKGVPDTLIFDHPPGRGAAGVAIELKRRKGSTTSEEQVKWLAMLRARGWLTYVCKGAAEAVAVIEELWP